MTLITFQKQKATPKSVATWQQVTVIDVEASVGEIASNFIFQIWNDLPLPRFPTDELFDLLSVCASYKLCGHVCVRVRLLQLISLLQWVRF